MNRTQNKNGFTIVELLIVIVVIGILAAITIVAFSAIQQQARDAERKAEMKTIEKAIQMYRIDNDGYPTCTNTTYVVGDTANACFMDSIANSLVPKYMAQMPTDPINSGNDRYRYGVGYQKTSATGFNTNNSDNYITGMKLESVSTIVSGWTSPQYYTYLGGS